MAAVLARLAQQVGVLFARSNEAIARLGAVLSTRTTVVVFDNAEHLTGLTGLAGFIDDLLAAAPLLRVFAASCVRLRSTSPVECKAMAELSWFRAGFSARATRAVAGMTITLIASLVDKSLVHVNDHGQFGLHPLVLAHVLMKLRADEALAAAARHHLLASTA